ncbi:MAG: ankyrin repeat domain-containing protein, partial [Planctomycetota bacterium]
EEAKAALVQLQGQLDRGESALHYAARNGYRHLVEFLLDEGADMSSINTEGFTPIEVAMMRGYRSIVELLVAKGAEVSIHIAVYLGDVDQVSYFIESGVNVDARDKIGLTPLDWAAKTSVELVKLLVAEGADVGAKDKWGWTPLDSAAYAGHVEIAELLIDKGADVNSRYNWGQTPLIWAAQEGHKTVAELLIARGADINTKDNQGRTALWYAQDKGHTEIVELLRKYGAKGDEAEVTQDNRLPILDVERKRNGTYLTIRTERIPGLLLDVWCYEDRLGDATRYEKQGNAVVLIHKLEEATVTTLFEPRQTDVDIQVHVTGPTAVAVRKVQRLNPCCQFARSAAFRSEGNYVDDFVARCFVFLDAGMTLLKDTKRIPGTRPRTDDKANYPKPWIQEYFPAWRKHPGQIKGQRGYSPDRPVYPIIGVVSQDGKYLAAIAWPETASLGQVWHHCIHPRPLIAESFDPKTSEIRSCGKIYLMENDEEKLLARFKEDFPRWRRPLDVK